jgi:hypothetical protein
LDEGIEEPMAGEQAEKMGYGLIDASREAKRGQRQAGSSRLGTCRNLTQLS